jgi:hypothetical protein
LKQFRFGQPVARHRRQADCERPVCEVYRAARYGLTRTGLSPVGLHQLSLAPSQSRAKNGQSANYSITSSAHAPNSGSQRARTAREASLRD